MVREGFQVRLLESRWGRFLLLALAGVLTGLTLIFDGLGLLEWMTLIPFGLVLYQLAFGSQITIKQAYGYGFFFFMSLYLVVYHWFVYMYPLEFTGLDRGAAVFVVILAWIGLALLASLAGGLVFVFASLLGKSELVRRRRFLMAFIVAALWVIFEWSQTLTFAGVPWGRLAIGQVGLIPMIQTASIFGSYFISFIIVAVNMCLAFGIFEVGRVRLGAIVALCLVLGNLISGCLILAIDDKGEETMTAAVVQGNIDLSSKWAVEISDIIDVYSQYSFAAAGEGVDLIIWPETAVPTLLGKGAYTERLRYLATDCGVPILVGIFTGSKDGDRNSLVLFSADGMVGEEKYSKRHLVPFGEYVPFRDILSKVIPPLAEIAVLGEDLSAGEGSGLIDIQGATLAPLICFDSIYERLTLQSIRDGGEIIILSTNDAWFYDSAAGRMHLAQACLRAVETDRAVFRAANTGISAIIDSDGRVLDYLPALEGGYLIGELELSDSVTPYVFWGNIFVIFSAVFLVAVAIFEFVRRFQNRRSSC